MSAPKRTQADIDLTLDRRRPDTALLRVLAEEIAETRPDVVSALNTLLEQNSARNRIIARRERETRKLRGAIRHLKVTADRDDWAALMAAIDDECRQLLEGASA